MTRDQWAKFWTGPPQGAVAEGDSDLANKLVKAGALRRLVHGAAGDRSCRRNLLRGAQSRVVDLISKAMTPDQWGCSSWADKGDIGLVDKLVGAGGGYGFAVHTCRARGRSVGERSISRSYRRAKGITALHVAAEHGTLEMVELLLLKGADKDALEAWSPLRLAVYHARVAVVWALLAAGMDIKKEDARGYTPLHHAAEYGQLRRLLTRTSLATTDGRRFTWQSTATTPPWLMPSWLSGRTPQALVQRREAVGDTPGGRKRTRRSLERYDPTRSRCEHPCH